ncbi:ATPase, partial [Actinomyces ruminis]
YIVALVAATRNDAAIALGASPRAGLHLAAVARARAAMAGRGFVSPDDVAHAAVDVLAHRLIPTGQYAAAADALAASTRVLRRIVANLPVPAGD